jgi:hypothetical protein
MKAKLDIRKILSSGKKKGNQKVTSFDSGLKGLGIKIN